MVHCIPNDFYQEHTLQISIGIYINAVNESFQML